MMRMFGSFVCISTLRVFPEVAGSLTDGASGSPRLLRSGKVCALIDRVSGLFNATDAVRSAATPGLFLR